VDAREHRRDESPNGALGLGYDWATEIATCLPEYYRWNQWFFLRMYEKGLVYRKKSKVNWCPECATVLANEQVVDGCCWRHETTQVDQRDLVQWFFASRRTRRSCSTPDKLDGWPEKVRTMQRNWIAAAKEQMLIFSWMSRKQKKRASAFHHPRGHHLRRNQRAVGPEHELTRQFAAADPKLKEQVTHDREQKKAREAGDLGAIEKHGVPPAVMPSTLQNQRVPIWVANYILADYGTGAIMSVPGHDERDFEFATKYNLPIVE